MAAIYRHLRIQAQMDLHGDEPADVPHPQVPDASHIGNLPYHPADAFHKIPGRRGIDDPESRIPPDLPTHSDDEKGHEETDKRIGHRESRMYDGKADGQEHTHGGQGVASVVPGVGNKGGASFTSCRAHGDPIEPLLAYDAEKGGRDDEQGRTNIGGVQEGFSGVIDDQDAGQDENTPKGHLHQYFHFSMPIVVALVSGLCTDNETADEYGVGHQVCHGVETVGHKRTAVAKDAKGQFENDEDHVEDGADDGNPKTVIKVLVSVRHQTSIGPPARSLISSGMRLGLKFLPTQTTVVRPLTRRVSSADRKILWSKVTEVFPTRTISVSILMRSS